MPETLEPKVKETLRKYVSEVKTLGNEAAKRSRFMALIAELFPGTNAVTDSARGIEKLIRIQRPEGEKKGRADAYYGNAIIEFEKSLDKTLKEAEHQLCEYVAGTWQKEKSARPMIAVASDGLNWIIYRPVLAAGAKPTPSTVTLEEIRKLKVGEDSLSSFWLWMTSFLFRAQQIEPTAERFQLDFGSSLLYGDSMAALKRAWAKVSDGSEAILAFETWQKYLTVTYGRLTEDTTAHKDKETAEEISELESLFLRHTYLSSIARLLIWAALSRGKSSGSLGDVARSVFGGEFFQSKRLANLVDDDFFHWIRHPEAEKILIPAWERILSHLLEYDLSQVREDVLKGVYQELIDPKDRHELGEYSIWSFIIRNSYRPAMLKGQFDYIIGNPPWLAYRFISDPEYQKEVKTRAIERYGIAPKHQKLFTQMELATVFLAHSMATFARPDAKLGFVMPRAVLNADQHQNLIRRDYKSDAKFRLTSYWDLWDVSPLFNVPACVLFAQRFHTPGNWKDKLPVLEWYGTLPGRDVNWETAKDHLYVKEKTGRVIYLGTRAALSTAPGASAPSKPSKYQDVFKQGATIVPRSIYFVQIDNLDGKRDPDTSYWAETEPEQAAQAKKPYDDVKMEGQVEGRFIYSTAVSRHLVPYSLVGTVKVVLPLEEKHGELHVLTAAELTAKGYRKFGKWMHEAEEIWNTKRKDKADKQSLYERLDYQKELTRQDLKQRYLVLYNHSGMNVAAAFFDRGVQEIPFIVDVKLYWAAFSTKEEADYVAAILNSETVNAAIKPFQSVGLLGERDIHKKLLELPIPTFHHENHMHVKISELGAKARHEAVKAIKSGTFPLDSSIAKQRSFMRKHLKDEMEEIDDLVAKLLG
jgi:hypothetical protein